MVKDYSLVFEVSQRTQDLHVLNLINLFFIAPLAGNVYTDIKRVSRYRLRVNNNNLNLLISHFNNYPLVGNKALQYAAWLKLANHLMDKTRSRSSGEDLKLEKLLIELRDLK